MKEKLEVIREALEMYSDGELHGNVPAMNSLALLDSLIAELDDEDLLERIVDKGIADFCDYDRKRGSARAQVITKWDDSHYWIAKAAIDAIKGI